MKHRLTAVDGGGVRRTYLVEAASRRDAEKALARAGLCVVEEERPPEQHVVARPPNLIALSIAAAALIAVPLCLVAALAPRPVSGSFLTECYGFSLAEALLLSIPALLIIKGLRRWDTRVNTFLFLLATWMATFAKVGIWGEDHSMLTIVLFLAGLFLGLLLAFGPGPD